MSEHDRPDDGHVPQHLAGRLDTYEPDRLARMFRRQLFLQRVGRELDPPAMTGEERGWYATWNHTALIKELGEALDEIAWKPWSVDKTTFNREQYMKELVDAWHFLMNLILLAGSPNYTEETIVEELANWFYKGYVEKSAINYQRFTSGTYDAKSTKCPDCGREVTEQIRVPAHDRTDPVEVAYACPMICGRINYAPVTS